MLKQLIAVTKQSCPAYYMTAACESTEASADVSTFLQRSDMVSN